MKHFFSLSLLLLALLLPATATAHDFEVDGIYYNINGTEATVTYKGTSYSQYSDRYSGSVTIPATVTYNGMAYSVTSIGSAAFDGCDGLTSVTIGNSVISIGYSAFEYCSNLTNIDIPNSVTAIGDEAFFNCSGLTSVTIGNSVTSISHSAFRGCSSLTSISVASGNPTYDSRNNCNAIIETASNTLITGCIDTLIPNSVTSIGGGAFSGCSGLYSIDIPNSVTSIGDGAFSECSSLTIIDIPNSVTFIGDGAFYGCSWLTDIDLPSVTSIGEWTFAGTGLTDIYIPNTVTTIGEGAFYECIGLFSIYIPNSVTSIGDMAFSECSRITRVTIPNSVTYIGWGAFEGCYNMTEIYCWAFTPPEIESVTFSYFHHVTLYVPEIAIDNYRYADYWNNFTNIVGIPYTFEIDGTSYRATTMNTANVIANIVDEATLYSGDVVIPGVVTYEDQTFAVTGIENSAFEDCYELTSVVIPNSVTDIGEQAFQGCTGLTNVVIGSGVTTIGAKAFNYCNALETVKCLGTVPPVMASTDCFSTAAYNRATLLVPRNFEAAYTATDYWYKFAHIDGWGSAGLGDVNGDGAMSIGDVTTLIDVLIGNEVDSFYFESGDMNGNGRIDIGDVTSLIDGLLYGF